MKTKTKEAVQLQIPINFTRRIDTAEEKVLEVVIVSDVVDRYDTIIKPEGMRTDPGVIVIAYNHRGVSTGAYLTNTRVIDDYEVEGINGSTEKIRALVGEIRVPKTAEMFYFDQDGRKRSNGNLFEAVEAGHIRSVSINFRPVKQSTDTRTGVTTYLTYDVVEISVLDVAPGQQYSGVKVIRGFLNESDRFEPTVEKRDNTGEIKISYSMQFKKKDKVLLRAVISDVDEENNKYTLAVDNASIKGVGSDLVRSLEEKPAETPEEEPEGDKPAEAPTEDANSTEKMVKSIAESVASLTESVKAIAENQARSNEDAEDKPDAKADEDADDKAEAEALARSAKRTNDPIAKGKPSGATEQLDSEDDDSESPEPKPINYRLIQKQMEQSKFTQTK